MDHEASLDPLPCRKQGHHPWPGEKWASCIIEVRGNHRKMGLVRQKGKASAQIRRKRRLRFYRTRLRELKMIAKALLSTKHPVLVHIIPMRRCNLDCGYCNEYDDVSKPVPLEEMKRRLDALAAMGTSV